MREAEKLREVIDSAQAERPPKKGAHPAGESGAETASSLRVLQRGLQALSRDIETLWSLQSRSVLGLPVATGIGRTLQNAALCEALDAWAPPVGIQPDEAAASSLPPDKAVVLWPKTRGENPLKDALAAAGLQTIQVLAPGTKEGFSQDVLSAEKALRLYGDCFVVFLCTDLCCLPFADAFPNKLLWLAPPEDAGECSGESYDELYLRAQQNADIETPSGADAAQKEKDARKAATLWQQRQHAGADLVFLSSVNDDDLPGRPQNLARLAAESGRRVLFINAGGRKETTQLVRRQGSLYVFELAAGTGEGRLGSRGVLDAKTPDAQSHLGAELEKVLAAMRVKRAILQVEHPFWAEAAFALRRRYRLPILFDYYDDFAVRKGAPATELRRAEKSLLAGADFVVCASSALAKRAGQRGPRFATVRNGCDWAHFSKGTKPRDPSSRTPVLGYYGAITTTFHFEMIRALNDSGIDVEIRLIGKADPEAKKRLAKYSKVRLMDEVPYEALPAALAEFDLALLAYNTENPVIEVANPAKFYEYLAAGKPVVSTAVPELMVFRGKYACLENDPGWFVRRVRECLDGISPLVDSAACTAFAKQNDWSVRAQDFASIYNTLEVARGKAIHGDIWAEQASLSDGAAPEKPMLALPPVEKKKKGEDIPKMQLAGAMATLRELEDVLQQKDEKAKKALHLLHQPPAPAGGLLKGLALGKNEQATPLQTAEKLLRENLSLSERRAQNAFAHAPGTDIPPLSAVYTRYDVLLFAVTDYEQKQRRCAQLALQYAENGHRVFYVNAHFSGMPSVTKKRENLFLVELPGSPGSSIYEGALSETAGNWQSTLDGMLWHFGIRDAITVVSYPNWVGAAEYLKNRLGFKIIVDYHSDFTGFLAPGSDDSEANGMRLLTKADCVIPTTEALALNTRQVRGGAAPKVVPNGCDYALFHAAFSPTQPRPLPTLGEDGQPDAGMRRPVAGFCGTLSHWFNATAVCEMARQLPEVDFVLAGQVVEWEQELRSLPNIRLVGEKSHEEIPALLKTFDLAVLPFDMDADISETLCPTFFYECLAAGKKVVASALPCLREYDKKHVLLAETPAAFVQAIKTVLAGKDSLALPKDRAAFAAEQDWQKRWEAFSSLALVALPSVGIVLCTKDNLEHCMACIAGILSQTAYPNYEIIVVDRGSSDGTREVLRESEEAGLPNLRVLFTDEADNYAAGCNHGIRQAVGDFLVLLEDDTLVTRGWLTALLGQMERTENLGLCTPATNLGGGEAKVPVYYRNADEMAQYAYLYTWQHLGENRQKGKSLSLYCAMLRHSTLIDLGPLDEDYTGSQLCGYDLSMTLRKNDLLLAVAEDAFVHRSRPAAHGEADAGKPAAPFETDKKHYEEKWGNPWKARGHRPGVTRDMNLDSLFPVKAPSVEEEKQMVAQGGKSEHKPHQPEKKNKEKKNNKKESGEKEAESKTTTAAAPK